MSSQIKKAYADTPNGQIHYRYSTPIQPHPEYKPLILLHKSASSSVSYTHLMTHYTNQGYSCYAPDMPGFGGSLDPDPDVTTLDTTWYIAIFLHVFHTLGLYTSTPGDLGKIHLIGHHSGAVLAVEFAAKYPDFVESICLVGPAVMSLEERVEMKEKYFETFNAPVQSGEHLQKTWDYLKSMGVGEDLGLWQREAIDHVRAWRGRNLIYGAVWGQDGEKLYKEIECRTLLLCARDDVLWKFFEGVKGLRTRGVESAVIGGGNFALDRDWEGIANVWTQFLEKK